MKHFKIILNGLIALTLMFTSCENENIFDISELKSEVPNVNYKVLYSDQQIANWDKTGSPFLENELDNSSKNFIDSFIPSQGGVFKPIPILQTRAFGVNPNQNRFWSMIRLKLSLTNNDEPLRSFAIAAISKIEEQTNI